MVGVSFWFLNAPAVRYATGWIVLPLLLLVAHIAPRPYEVDAFGVSPITGYARLLGNSSVRAGDLWKRIWKCVPARFHLRQTFFGKPSGWMVGAGVAAVILILLLKLPKSIGAYDFPRIPVAEVETRQTRGGLQVQVPKTGDQCWAADIPCVPNGVKPGIVLRNTRLGLRAGFARAGSQECCVESAAVIHDE